MMISILVRERASVYSHMTVNWILVQTQETPTQDTRDNCTNRKGNNNGCLHHGEAEKGGKNRQVNGGICAQKTSDEERWQM